MDYSECVIQLEARPIFPDRAPSLVPTRKALESLRLQINPQKTIVIAGTNGKGSTAAALERLLLSAGKSVGLYTSPHLIETRERIRINGEDISREAFVDSFLKVQERAVGAAGLTHFEMLTLMATWAFHGAQTPVEWAIYEVGLGGTWDATNAIPHAWSVITKLGVDHENILGSTLEKIASNKFGIVSNDNQVFHAPFDPSLAKLVAKRQERTNTHGQWLQATEANWINEKSTVSMSYFTSKWGGFEAPLPGRRSGENLGLALEVFGGLGFSPREHTASLAQLRWPGRFELVANKAILSGDHNPQGIESLIEILHGLKIQTPTFLLGFSADKDFDGMLRRLTKEFPKAKLYFTRSPFKGRKVLELGYWIDQAVAASDNIEQILQQLLTDHSKDSAADSPPIITGSLYLVGAVRRILTAGS